MNGLHRDSPKEEPIGKEKIAIQVTYFSILASALLAIVKMLAGFFGNSYALIADAVESVTDVFSSLLVLLGLHYAKRPADKNHPYGHGKIEPLVTFALVSFLVASAGVIVYQSLHNIFTPHESPRAWTLLVLGVIILWKEISFQVVIRKSKEINSSSLRAEAWHHRSDAITSLMAFVGISISVIFGEGYETADDWAALLAAGFILYNSYLIFRPALGEIMDEHLYDPLIEDIRRLSVQVDGVIETEKCFVRKAGMTYHVDLHVVVDATISVKEGHAIAHRLQNHLKERLPQICQVLVHVEPDK